MARYKGTTANDTYAGTAGIDYIYGLRGHDVLSGGDGNDVIAGGAGNDTLNGGNGRDRLYGEKGNDTLNGNDGNDYLNGSSGNDTLFGGTGNDYIHAGVGNDTVNGDAGADILIGSDGNDAMYGGADADSVYGDNGNDAIDGGLGNDVLFGGSGNDTVAGDLGNDFIYGGDGNDTLNGGAGDDTITAGAGTDTIDGGADTFTGDFGFPADQWGGDWLSYADATSAITLNAETGVTGGAAAGDTFTGIECFLGSAFNDTFWAKDTANSVIYAGAGDDTIYLGDMISHVRGGAGSDVIIGKAGGGGVFVAEYRQGFDEFRDFKLGSDLVGVSKSEFGLQSSAGGVILASEFQAGTSHLAATADVRLIYETDTKILWADLDGSGSQFVSVAVALIEGGVDVDVLSALDFAVLV